MKNAGLLARFPRREVILEETDRAHASLLVVEEMVRSGRCANGYLYIARPGMCDLLLFYKQAIHSAVRLEQGRFGPLSVAELFKGLDRVPPARVRLCSTDVGLILLMAVVLQNRPTLKVTSNLADVERMLAELEKRAKPAAIVVSRGGDHNLIYCRDGRPTASYFAEGVAPPSAEAIGDQILEYCYAAPDEETVLEIFHDLRSKRDENAGQRFKELLSGASGPPPFFVVVRHGKEVVERRLIKGGRAEIGRDPANDIVIDHLSVSRQHCTIEWKDGVFLIQDSGSSHGITVNGVTVKQDRLNLGDRIYVGEFEIMFGDEEAAPQEALRTLFVPGRPQLAGAAKLMFRDTLIPLDNPVFSMGKGNGATLKLSGFFMRPIQATIVREANGTHRLLAAKGGKAVSVNGESLQTTGKLLASGDAIAVGKHEMVFLLADAAEA